MNVEEGSPIVRGVASLGGSRNIGPVVEVFVAFGVDFINPQFLTFIIVVVDSCRS